MVQAASLALFTSQLWTFFRVAKCVFHNTDTESLTLPPSFCPAGDAEHRCERHQSRAGRCYILDRVPHLAHRPFARLTCLVRRRQERHDQGLFLVRTIVRSLHGYTESQPADITQHNFLLTSWGPIAAIRIWTNCRRTVRKNPNKVYGVYNLPSQFCPKAEPVYWMRNSHWTRSPANG